MFNCQRNTGAGIVQPSKNAGIPGVYHHFPLFVTFFNGISLVEKKEIMLECIYFRSSIGATKVRCTLLNNAARFIRFSHPYLWPFWVPLLYFLNECCFGIISFLRRSLFVASELSVASFAFSGGPWRKSLFCVEFTRQDFQNWFIWLGGVANVFTELFLFPKYILVILINKFQLFSQYFFTINSWNI